MAPLSLGGVATMALFLNRLVRLISGHPDGAPFREDVLETKKLYNQPAEAGYLLGGACAPPLFLDADVRAR